MTTQTQAEAAIVLLTHRATTGVTWRELAAAEHIGHGSASRVLSDLHRTGHVVRLTTAPREGCAVYVLPEHLGDREGRPFHHRPPADREDAAAMAAAVLGVVERWGLDSSAAASMQGLAADLRRAVNRPHPDDALTLGGPHA